MSALDLSGWPLQLDGFHSQSSGLALLLVEALVLLCPSVPLYLLHCGVVAISHYKPGPSVSLSPGSGSCETTCVYTHVCTSVCGREELVLASSEAQPVGSNGRQQNRSLADPGATSGLSGFVPRGTASAPWVPARLAHCVAQLWTRSCSLQLLSTSWGASPCV